MDERQRSVDAHPVLPRARHRVGVALRVKAAGGRGRRRLESRLDEVNVEAPRRRAVDEAKGLSLVRVAVRRQAAVAEVVVGVVHERAHKGAVVRKVVRAAHRGVGKVRILGGEGLTVLPDGAHADRVSVVRARARLRLVRAPRVPRRTAADALVRRKRAPEAASPHDRIRSTPVRHRVPATVNEGAQRHLAVRTKGLLGAIGAHHDLVEEHARLPVAAGSARTALRLELGTVQRRATKVHARGPEHVGGDELLQRVAALLEIGNYRRRRRLRRRSVRVARRARLVLLVPPQGEEAGGEAECVGHLVDGRRDHVLERVGIRVDHARAKVDEAGDGAVVLVEDAVVRECDRALAAVGARRIDVKDDVRVRNARPAVGDGAVARAVARLRKLVLGGNDDRSAHVGRLDRRALALVDAARVERIARCREDERVKHGLDVEHPHVLCVDT
eukprot:Opistho-1_new@15760